MRFLVACGIERAEGESLRTAETVPGVSPRCSATALSVTTGAFWPGFLVGAMGYFQTSGPWEWAVSRTNDLITNLVSRTVHAVVDGVRINHQINHQGHEGAQRKTLRITPSSYFVSLVVDEFGTR